MIYNVHPLFFMSCLILLFMNSTIFIWALQVLMVRVRNFNGKSENFSTFSTFSKNMYVAINGRKKEE